MTPFEAGRGDLVLRKPKQVGHVLALWGRGFVLRNRLDLQQGHLRVFGACDTKSHE